VADAVDRGATVDVGGHRLTRGDFARGFFFEPTLLSGCTDDMLVATEETFGPVAPVFGFETEAEVLERANATPYGLAAYFYTKDAARTIRVAEALEYGIVGVNDPRPASPTAPFGGFKQSGLGREGGQEGIDAFLETKLVSVGIG
jgi:succinate-semialdehyde dehydrogenase/glutarate-semialdehyde dehydrogenase